QTEPAAGPVRRVGRPDRGRGGRAGAVRPDRGTGAGAVRTARPRRDRERRVGHGLPSGPVLPRPGGVRPQGPDRARRRRHRRARPLRHGPAVPAPPQVDADRRRRGRRARPHVAARAGALTQQEMLSTIFQLIVAGPDTTTSLIGNATVALLRHPAQRDALVADPELAPRVVEEAMRWDAPVPHSTFRYTTEEVRIGDTVVPADAQVIVSLAAANRDPARYRDPDRFDIHRSDGGHLALGHGIHHCLGAPLARLEGRIALAALHTRFPRM